MNALRKSDLSRQKSNDFFSNALQLAVSTTLQITDLASENEKTFQSNLKSVVKQNSLPEISLDQVSWHDQYDDCWVVLYDRVYDVTKFLDEHPGGADVLLEYAGRDATLAYRGFGHSPHAWQILQKYLVGVLPEKERMDMFKQCEMGMNFQLKAASS